jgi:hypothetical protein
MHHIPLNRAQLCCEVSCEAISDYRENPGVCPACAGRSVVMLSTFLDRDRDLRPGMPGFFDTLRWDQEVLDCVKWALEDGGD